MFSKLLVGFRVQGLGFSSRRSRSLAFRAVSSRSALQKTLNLRELRKASSPKLQLLAPSISHCGNMVRV